LVQTLRIISLLLDKAGFFEWAALHVARWGRGSGRRLFVLLVLLGAALAALFANDGAAMGTGVVTAVLSSIMNNIRPSAYYDRIVNVMEELFKMTLLLWGRTDYLTDRYSERSKRAKKAIDRQVEKI
jgi:arsenical pump membrane protein